MDKTRNKQNALILEMRIEVPLKSAVSKYKITLLEVPSVALHDWHSKEYK